ncbi:MAG: hypothetical protein ACYC8V_09215 [Caulobacteraceae bacterium]
MPVRYEIDDHRRRLSMALSGTVNGREFSDFLCDLYGARVELFDYECLVDMLAYEGDLTAADLIPLQRIYAARPGPRPASRPGVTVTSDPNFHLWAAALDAQFPGRKHYVAASLEEACARLDGLRNGDGTGSQD